MVRGDVSAVLLRFAVAVLAMFWSATSIAQSAASAFTTGTRYDAERRVVGTIAPDPDGTGPLHYAAVRNTYDDAGRLTLVEKGELSTWKSEAVDPSAWGTAFTVQQQLVSKYDDLDRKIREEVKDGAGTILAVTEYSYDLYGRAECTAVRMNPSAWGSSTNACTRQATGSNGADRITRNIYDLAGQLVVVQKAVGSSLQQNYAGYSYTADSKQATVTDANGNKAKFDYDGFDRLAKWSFPSKTTAGAVSATDFEAYGYDPNGNRLSLTKRDGSVLGYSYDALNRMKVKTVPARSGLTTAQTRSVFYAYDLLGHQTEAHFDSTTGSDKVTMGFNAFGELTSSAITMATFSKSLAYNYDADGNRTSITHSDNSQVYSYAYDGLDRLANVYEGAGTTTNLDAFTYNADGTLFKRSEGTGTSYATYSWDGIGRLTGQSDTIAGAGYPVSWTFTINPASQVLTDTRNNDAYAYGGLVAVNRNYSVNGLNQYTAAGSASFTYDANGNLTGDGTNTYTYDNENRLVKAVVGTTTTNLVYDPLGRLFQTDQGSSSTTEMFLYDGDALVAEYTKDATSLTARYVHGSNAAADDPLVWYTGSSSGSKRWLHADRLGSIVAITNQSGSGQYKNAYDEYGMPGSANQGRFQYTGQIYIAELGIYYYKARMYSATLGRFLQTDPIGYDGGINLYAYVSDDPVNGVDPDGEFDCPERECQTISSAINLAKDEALQPETGSHLVSSQGKEIASSLDALGSANDHNGTVIQNGALPANTFGSTLGNTITLDFAKIRKEGGAIGYMVGAGVIVHEATHLSDNRRSGQISNNGQRFLRERHAFRNQSYIYHKIGIRPFGLGFPRWGEDRFSTDLNNAARADCEISNQENHLPEGCQ